MAEALAQGYLWREAIVALKGCGICIGGGDIAWSFDKLRMYCMCIMSLREGVLSLSKQLHVIFSILIILLAFQYHLQSEPLF